jgi:hypothetical protein
MHPDLIRQIAADRIADLTEQAVRSRRARSARRLLRNPLCRIVA